MTLPKAFGGFVLLGVKVDLALFAASFAVFGGAHGPAGPMFVLNVLNAPVLGVVNRLWPAERSTDLVDLLLAFLVVIVNGALYGAVAGLVVLLRRFFGGIREGRK